MKWIKLVGFAFGFSLFYSFVVYQFSKVFQVIVGINFGGWDTWLINLSSVFLFLYTMLANLSHKTAATHKRMADQGGYTDHIAVPGLEKDRPSLQEQSRMKSTPSKATSELTTSEKIDAALRTPETARSLYLFLVKIGQIPPKEYLPTEEVDSFFGAKPMSLEQKAEYEESMARWRQ